MSAHIPRETDQHDERPAPGVSRRDMLLAGTALAASTLSGASALAQAQQAQPPRRSLPDASPTCWRSCRTTSDGSMSALTIVA